jgi:C4-dicarboxylate transporter DctM subunit
VASKQANVSIEKLSVSVLPFLLAMLLVVLPIVVFPQISLFLPELLR